MDLTQALEHLRSAHPGMAEIIDRVGPCTLIERQETGELFEVLVSAIVSQQLSGKAAATIHRRFCALWPEKSHPQPADVLTKDIEELRTVGLSRPKASYILDLAGRCQGELPTLSELETWHEDAIVDRLSQVKGIGRWTVEMLLIFRLGRLDVWPVDDLGVRKGLGLILGLEAMPKPKEAQRLGEPFRPYRSVAAWYCWRAVD